MVAIPLLMLPFLCLLFWALGGGPDASAQPNEMNTGLNTALPEPKADLTAGDDKMTVYQSAATDSLQLEEKMRNDPYYQRLVAEGWQDTATPSYLADPDIEEVNSKMAVLSQALQPQSSNGAPPPDISSGYGLAAMQPDPEMEQLDAMLDKILDIQDPQRAKEKLRTQSIKNKKQVYTIAPKGAPDLLSGLSAGKNKTRNPQKAMAVRAQGGQFFEWSGTDALEEPDGPAVAAIISQTTTVVTGSTIKLRTEDDIMIRGVSIPKGTFIFGTCALSGDRLQIAVQSIRHKNSLLPVSLTTYDMDGIAGIYMPGAISRDVAKNTAQDAVQGIDYYGVENSLTAQAAGVGIQAAKSLLTKKARLVKVSVRAGYKVLLKDENVNSN